MDERRELPRWEIKKESRAWIPLSQGFSHCVIEDMHLKGMCVSFNRQLPELKTVRMSFTLGDSFDFIKIEADVPWMKQFRDRFVYGLSFSKIAEEDKDKISQYISANCYDQLKDKWWSK